MAVHENIREALTDVTGVLQRWADENRDVAHIVTDQNDGYWRLSAQPSAPDACPFELIIHDDGEHYSLSVDSRNYADLRTRNLQILPALVLAITDGRVLTSHLISSRTGVLAAIETTIQVDGETLQRWRQLQHVTSLPHLLNTEDCERQTRHYLPYRRARTL